MRGILAIALVASLAFVTAEKARYDNYQVRRVIPSTHQQLELLHQLETTNEFSFWRSASRLNAPVDILVPPHKRAVLNDILNEAGLQADTNIENVQKLMDDEEKHTSQRSTKAIDWTNYHRLTEIYDWLDQLAEKNSNIKVVKVGTTYEGREIRGIEITNGANLPGVILESGIHAREWIAPAATSWIINQFVNSKSDSIWRQFNYLYIPILNADGYEYTWAKDRAWRKTRTPYKVSLLTCYGADPNRNWDWHWMEGGSSGNACSDTYAGPKAHSEVEIASFTTYLASVSSKYDIYLAFHSFSQLILYPWGYTGQDTPMEATWKRIGTAAAKDIKAVHGKSFDVGSIYDTIYQASGSSMEWYYGNFNSTLSFAFELRDTGENGFMLPANQIVPSGEELIEALRRFFTEYQTLPKKIKH